MLQRGTLVTRESTVKFDKPERTRWLEHIYGTQETEIRKLAHDGNP